jgi:ATP-binding cassette subfamily C (CFTR/MRP) protein 1
MRRFYQALARALYSRSPLLILDDVWSGLDSENARLIEENLFGDNGYCRKAGLSVIITAHSGMIFPSLFTTACLCSLPNQYCLVPPFVDHVVILQEGSVIDSGSYEDVIARAPETAHGLPSHMAEIREDIGGDAGAAISDIPVVAGIRPEHEAPAHPTLDPEQYASRSDGSWSTYLYYINRAGRWKIACFLVCCLSSALFANIVSE